MNTESTSRRPYNPEFTRTSGGNPYKAAEIMVLQAMGYGITTKGDNIDLPYWIMADSSQTKLQLLMLWSNLRKRPTGYVLGKIGDATSSFDFRSMGREIEDKKIRGKKVFTEGYERAKLVGIDPIILKRAFVTGFDVYRQWLITQKDTMLMSKADYYDHTNDHRFREERSLYQKLREEGVTPFSLDEYMEHQRQEIEAILEEKPDLRPGATDFSPANHPLG